MGTYATYDEVRADALFFLQQAMICLRDSRARASFTTGFDSPAVLIFPPGLKSLLAGPGVLTYVPYFPHMPNSCIASNSRAQISLDHRLKNDKQKKRQSNMPKSMPISTRKSTNGYPHSEYAWPAPGLWEAS